MSKETYSADFDLFWSVYPKRDRPDSKVPAFKAWKARLKEDILPTLLTACAREYAAYLTRKGKAGTEFVLMAATFLGPHERWKAYTPKPAVAVRIKKARSTALPEEERPDPEVGKAFVRELLQKLASAKTSPTCGMKVIP